MRMLEAAVPAPANADASRCRGKLTEQQCTGELIFSPSTSVIFIAEDGKSGDGVKPINRLQSYSVESAIAVITDGGATLSIDTQHLRDISFRTNSIYQFIGELLIPQDNQVMLRARIGRNVDGIDLNLYHQSIQLRRRFEADIVKSKSTRSSLLQ